MPLKNSKRINVDLPTEMFKEFKEAVYIDRIHIADVVRKAIKSYLKHRK